MTTKMLGQLCVTKFQNLSNLCIELVQKHQTETVVSTLKPWPPLTKPSIYFALSCTIYNDNIVGCYRHHNISPHVINQIYSQQCVSNIECVQVATNRFYIKYIFALSLLNHVDRVHIHVPLRLNFVTLF